MGLREDLAAETPPLGHRDVVVAEWKGRVVRIPELDGLDRVEVYEAVYADAASGKQTTRQIALQSARAVALVARDPTTGDRCFEDSDVEMLARRHAGAVRRLFAAFCEVNGFGGKEVEAAAGKPDAAGNAAPPTA